MNTQLKISAVTGLMLISSMTFADVASLKQQEGKIIQQYQKADFFEVNGDLEQQIIGMISKDPDSFKHDFSDLQKKDYVSIQYSPDKKLKFYTFDVSGGGTMGEWSSYVQYYTGKKLHLDSFEAGLILQVQAVKMKHNSVYLVRSYYKGDSCHGAHHLRAVELGKNQLLKADVFVGKQKVHHEISVEYDCHFDTDRTLSQRYFRIAPAHVDVMLLNEKMQPQRRYLRYTLGPNAYRYTGVVK